MPWLVGDDDTVRIIESMDESFPLQEMVSLTPSAYLGFLRPGFAAALKRGQFRPERVSLALRSGWRAVAVTARSDDLKVKRALAPFVAPTAPGPQPTSPLGFTLFSSPWINQAIPLGELGHSLGSLEWSRRLVGLLDAKSPAFCDPVLELELEEEDEDDELVVFEKCRPQTALQRVGQGLASLASGRWEATRK